MTAPSATAPARRGTASSGASQPGFSTLDPTATACLQSVGIAGKTLVQIGCNNGREALSALALGARTALGIDQPEAFPAQTAATNPARRSFSCATP